MLATGAIRGILFDKDGTLIDFNQTWFGIIATLAQQAALGDAGAARELIAQGGYDWMAQKFVGGSVGCCRRWKRCGARGFCWALPPMIRRPARGPPPQPWG